MNKLTRVDVSEQELEVFLNVADRLGIGVRDLLEKDVPACFKSGRFWVPECVPVALGF
jgi:hypothetical protein